MHRLAFLPPTAFIFLVGLAAPPSYSTPALHDFDGQVRPVLQAYCVKCHGDEQTRGEINLLQFEKIEQVLRQPKVWTKVAEKLANGEMPPEGKPQPPDDQRKQLRDWVGFLNTSLVDGSLGADPGRTMPRRLNRPEYNATVQDLFGVAIRPADDFPADGSGGGGFDNNAASLFLAPVLMEKYVTAAGKILDAVWADPALKKRALFLQPSAGLPAERAAHALLTYHALRCFRRPATPAEITPLLALFQMAAARGDSFDAALKPALKALLVSPKFLFRIEVDQPQATPYPLGNYDLAARLSYFLWSSCPDEELLRQAREGALAKPDVLAAQTRRLLADPRSRRFSESFASQWLGFDRLHTTAQPDKSRFPEFTPALRTAMFDEGVEMFHSVLADGASFLRLIDADYTFANDDLARHYGLPPVRGSQLQRVTLTDRNRGGVLGLGAVLVCTSLPLRTSPVLRGRWILDELLGTPLPPPPANAGSLPPDDRQADGLTLRQRLEKHRSNPACAGCHARLDPPGFGLENFDPIGRWRTDVAGSPIDTTGKLSTGETFSSPAELKKILSAKPDLIARNLNERLLAYALGRGLEFFDEPTLAALTKMALANHLDSHKMITAIVTSFPFTHRRNEPVAKF